MLQIKREYYKSYKEDLNQYTTGSNDIWVRESKFDRERICKVVTENEPEDYDGVLTKSESWWIHYHLNPVRESLLNWYDFREDGTLLEIGGELGALTGLFSRRCAEVTVLEKSYENAEIIAKRYRDRVNIQIYACEPEDLPEDVFLGKFDYIVLGKVLEEKGYGYWNQEMYSAYLRRIKRWLKPEGRLLITVNNRYGIKYLCGYRNPHTGIPFDGINKYPCGSKGYMLSRNELKVVLDGAKLAHYKFYYPLPDAVFPQLIYSDAYQDKSNINERLSFFAPSQDTCLVPEQSLYNDIMDNDVLHFLSNAFLVECSLNGELSDISYSVVSTDRIKERAFATRIMDKKMVKKIPLFPEGEGVLKDAYRNITELEKRGIPVVPHLWGESGIEMPYFKSEGLTAVLQRVVAEDKELFAEIIDTWYQYILMSSEHCISERYETERFGPVLKTAYIDLVPANAFYMDGSMYFYDQEFLRKECPAKYVLFRGLKYTYMSMWDMERLYPVQRFKDKYRLNEIWDIFEEEESQFIRDLKAGGKNAQLEHWKEIDFSRMVQRGRLLGRENTDLLNYSFTDRTKAIQQIQLELLREFQRVCEENNLTYYAFYGTLIGAVRHQGFVPWDDDIDVVMFREDYEKMLKIADRAFGERFFLQIPENDSECFYGNYAKLRANWTSAIEMMNWDKNCHQGIAMDIMPLDYCCMLEEENHKLQQRILLHQRLLFAKTYGENAKMHGMDESEFAMYKRMAESFSREELLEQLQRLFVSGDRESKIVATLSRYIIGKHIFYKKEDFAQGRRVRFETIEINIPENYDRLLQSSDKNYMLYPKEGERKAKHARALLSTKVSYQEYRRKFRGAFCDIGERKIVLVGEGRTLSAYFNTKAEQYLPDMIADILGDFKETSYKGVPVCAPSKLREIPNERRRVIICADDFMKYEQKLLGMGVWDYYIFAHTKWWLKVTEDEN